jgi:hypothetical protein
LSTESVFRRTRIAALFGFVYCGEMELESRWLVLYCLALNAKERGFATQSDALMRRALDEAIKQGNFEAFSKQAAVAMNTTEQVAV